METFKTKNLIAKWQVLSREYKATKYLEVSVTKKYCKKPFFYFLEEVDNVKDFCLLREIKLSYTSKYSDHFSEIEKESEEIQNEILEWLVEYIMDSLVS